MEWLVAADKKVEYRASNRSSGIRKGSETMKRGCKTAMKCSKKSNEKLRFRSTTPEPLLIGCNFFRKKASYLVECSGRELHYMS